MKIKNRIWMCLLTMMLCVGMFSTTAFAYVDESAVTETETITETQVETEEETETDTESTEETGNALTPDGNLTLVDDVGETSGTGKQFVTLVTKSGNYFYLIIDRDDEGNNTVHFLNQVDEADLFSLMEDEEAQKLQAELAEKEQQAETEPEVISEVKDEPVEEKEETNMIPAIATIVLLIGSAGVFAFMKLKEKKKAEEAAKPDPDADYDDDMEYDFMDEDSFEDREDEEFTEEEEEV